MPVADEELLRKHAVEERKNYFRKCVRACKERGDWGMDNACLQNDGYRDFYGPAVFARGQHEGLWIFPADKNPRALLYKRKADAEKYAKELQKLFRDNGYPFTKVWADPVAVRTVTPCPYSVLRAPKISFEKEARYLIRMNVR